jgi:hypothetical protein
VQTKKRPKSAKIFRRSAMEKKVTLGEFIEKHMSGLNGLSKLEMAAAGIEERLGRGWMVKNKDREVDEGKMLAALGRRGDNMSQKRMARKLAKLAAEEKLARRWQVPRAPRVSVNAKPRAPRKPKGPVALFSKHEPAVMPGTVPVAFDEKYYYVNSPEFLQSYEWRQLRFQALQKYGRRCQCCGASPETGAVMHVDHVKSRRKFPHLALDIENLQVLCEDCNHGKGNITADFRGG